MKVYMKGKPQCGNPLFLFLPFMVGRWGNSVFKNNVVYLAKAHTWHELKTFQFPH